MNTTDYIGDFGGTLSTGSTSITRDDVTGLLRIECMHAAAPDKEMTPERVAELLLEQEVNWTLQTNLEP